MGLKAPRPHQPPLLTVVTHCWSSSNLTRALPLNDGAPGTTDETPVWLPKHYTCSLEFCQFLQNFSQVAGILHWGGDSGIGPRQWTMLVLRTYIYIYTQYICVSTMKTRHRDEVGGGCLGVVSVCNSFK